jgi:hypothetical protein
MSNKRNLKNVINGICCNIAADVMAASLDRQVKTQEDIDAILSSIVILNRDYISRISHVEPGMAPKKYFKGLVEDFKKSLMEILDQINSIN